jgi:hypothetical protein
MALEQICSEQVLFYDQKVWGFVTLGISSSMVQNMKN